jgi:Cys-tRNA(Pro) deacylase
MNSTLRSLRYLESKSVPYKIIELTETPRTAQDIERLYGCSLNQVLKTVVLMSDAGPLVIVLQGNRKINHEKIKKLLNITELRMASPTDVQQITGYAIGGVSPFGLLSTAKTVLDRAVFSEKKINIGSGDPRIGIELSSDDLQNIWEGEIADIS